VVIVRLLVNDCSVENFMVFCRFRQDNMGVGKGDRAEIGIARENVGSDRVLLEHAGRRSIAMPASLRC
jgi:hypothetical protein